MLDLPDDARPYDRAAKPLSPVGITRLMTNNSDEMISLKREGIDVAERLTLFVDPTPARRTYIHTKRHRMGNLL